MLKLPLVIKLILFIIHVYVISWVFRRKNAQFITKPIFTKFPSETSHMVDEWGITGMHVALFPVEVFDIFDKRIFIHIDNIIRRYTIFNIGTSI